MRDEAIVAVEWGRGKEGRLEKEEMGLRKWHIWEGKEKRAGSS